MLIYLSIEDVENFYNLVEKDETLKTLIHKRVALYDKTFIENSRVFLETEVIPIAKNKGFNFNFNDCKEFAKKYENVLEGKNLSDISGGVQFKSKLSFVSALMFALSPAINLNSTFKEEKPYSSSYFNNKQQLNRSIRQRARQLNKGELLKKHKLNLHRNIQKPLKRIKSTSGFTKKARKRTSLFKVQQKRNLRKANLSPTRKIEKKANSYTFKNNQSILQNKEENIKPEFHDVENNSKPISYYNDVENLNIAEICNFAVDNYYSLKSPSLESVEVMHNGSREKWVNLSLCEKLKLLEEGARGADLNFIKRLSQSFRKNKENLSQEEKLYFEDIFNRQLLVYEGQFSVFHGPKHAFRACVLTQAIAEFYQKYVEEFKNLTNKEIKLACVAAAFHDSGRQGDGVDVFDGLSADNARKALLAWGISQEDANRCAEAIINKDADVVNKDLVAILLHEADVVEYMRLGNVFFESKYLDIFRFKSSVPEKEIKIFLSKSSSFISKIGSDSRASLDTSLSFQKVYDASKEFKFNEI